MSINVDVHGNTDPLVRDVDAAVKRINRTGGIKIRIDDKGVTQPLGNMKRSADEFTKSLEASNARVLAFGASVGIINAVSDAFKGLVTQTIAVEKNLTDINVVMGLTSKQLDKFGGGLFKVAAETGAGFQAASEAATEFARQGLSVAETLKRTKDALVLTRLTGMKSTEAVKSLTAAMNTFKGEVKDSTQLVSKFAAVDVKFAVSAQDFADAIARAGQAARDAGVDIDQLIGLVTAAQERTARGGAVIGNSFKTIFTRVQRGSTLKELENLGVAVRDLEGKTLPAMKVLQGLASRYDTLTDAQKSYISQNVAGVFQINILKAAMADLGKANSVTAQATEIAANATDESSKKNEQLRQTMAALASETGVAIQQLAKSIGDIALAPGINKVLDGVKGMADFAQGLLGDGEKEGSKFAKGLLAGVGNFLSGPGLVVLTAVVAKLFANAVKYGAQSLTSLLNINKAANQRKNIEQSLMMVMAQNAALSEEMLRNDLSRAEKEKLILNLIKQQTIEAQKLANISKSMTPGLLRSGVNQNLSYSRRGNRAFGFVPNFAADDEERKQAQAGGYAPGSVKAMNIPGHGPVIYNSAEKVKKFDGMSQPAIMPPSHSRAGKKYKDDFASAHGFDPYASHGFIPNFSLQALRSYLDKGGRAGSSNFPSLKKMQPYHHEFSKEWKGDRSSVSQYYGSPFPSKKDMDNYVKKHGYKDSEDFKKGLAAPGKALAAQQKILQKERVRKANSIDLNDPFYGINNINRLGVMLGSGNQVTKDKRYYQPFKELPSGNKDYLKQKWLSQYKGFNPSKQPKRAPKNASPTDKAKANEGIKKWKSINEKYQEWQSKQVSVKLPTKALYPVDLDDTNGMKGAIGKGQIKNLFSSNLSSGMDGLSNQLFSKIFPGKKSSITKSIDHITNNQSILGGLLEAGISAALGEKPTDDIGRAFDFEGSSAKTLAKWMGEENLNKIELKISDIASKTGKLPNKTLNVRNKAFGFIPNFADPLSDAIGREKEAGVPVSKIRVGTHKALVHKSNPMGMGVTNTDDEPRGLKDVFGARGFVPNYAESRGEKIGGMFGTESSIERMKSATEDAAAKMESLGAKVSELKNKKADLIDTASSQRKVLQERHAQLKKDGVQLKKDMNNRSLSSKQRQKAAQEFNRLEQQVKQSSNDLNRTRQRISSAHKKMKIQEDKLTTATATHSQIRRTASRRERMSQNRGMAGMAGMMGMSMLAGQLQQSNDPGMQAAAGGLNGASMGASIGMMFGPWGAAIGAAAGGLMGFVNATKEAEKALREMKSAALAEYDTKVLNETTQMFGALFNSQEGKAAFKQNLDSRKFNRQTTGGLDFISAMENRDLLHSKGEGRRFTGNVSQKQLDDEMLDLRTGNLRYGGTFSVDGEGPELANKNMAVFGRNKYTYGNNQQYGGQPAVIDKKFKDFSRRIADKMEEKYEGKIGVESDTSHKTPTIEFKQRGGDHNELTVPEMASAVTTGRKNSSTGNVEPMLITERGLQFESEFKDSDGNINNSRIEAARKVTEDFIKMVEQDLQLMKDFGEADYQKVSSSIDEFYKALNYSGKQTLTYGEALDMSVKRIKEEDLAIGNTKDSTEISNHKQKIKTLEAGQQTLLEDYIDSLDKDFREQIKVGGETMLVDKALLKKKLLQNKANGEYGEVLGGLIDLLTQQRLVAKNQTEAMEKTLKALEISAMLAEQMNTEQSAIKENMLKVKSAYAIRSAQLGKTMSASTKIEQDYQNSLAALKGKVDLSKNKLEADFKKNVITSFMTNEPESVQEFKAEYEKQEGKEIDNKELVKLLMGQNAEGVVNAINRITGAIDAEGAQRNNQLAILEVQTEALEDNADLEQNGAKYSRLINKLKENESRKRLEIDSALDAYLDNLKATGKSDARSSALSRERLITSRGPGPVTMRAGTDRQINDLRIDRDETVRAASEQSGQRQYEVLKKLSQDLNKDFSGDQIVGFMKDIASLEKLRTNETGDRLDKINRAINAVAQEKQELIEMKKHQEDITAEKEKQLNNQLKMTTGPGAYASGFDAYAKAASDRVDTFKYELGQAVPEAFSRNMSAAMMKVIREGGSWKEAMIDGLIGTLDTINQKFMDNWMDHLFSGFSQETPMDNLDNIDTKVGSLGSAALEAAGALKSLSASFSSIPITSEEKQMMNDAGNSLKPSQGSLPVNKVWNNTNPNGQPRNQTLGKSQNKPFQGPPMPPPVATGLAVPPPPVGLKVPKAADFIDNTLDRGKVNPLMRTILDNNNPTPQHPSQVQGWENFSDETKRNMLNQYDNLPTRTFQGGNNPNGQPRNRTLNGTHQNLNAPLQFWDPDKLDGQVPSSSSMTPTTSSSISTTSTSTVSSSTAPMTESQRGFMNMFPSYHQDAAEQNLAGEESSSIGGSAIVEKQDQVVQATKEQTEATKTGFMDLASAFQDQAKPVEEKVETTALGVQHETPPQTGAAHVNPNTGQYADPSLRKAQMEQVESVFAQAAQQSAQAIQNEAMQKDTHVQQMTEKAGTLQTSVQRVIETLGELSTAISTKAQEIQQIQIQQSMPSPGIGASAPGSYTGGILRRSGGGGVPAKVSDGEFVMNRDAVKKFGVSNMSILNSGRVPNSAQGYMPGFTNGGKPKIWDSDRINKQGAKESFGQGAATMALGFGLSKLFEKDKEENKAWERPDDYFQRNPTWKKRNMSKQFMLNDRRVAEEVQKERSKKNEETQKWIEKMNKRQALGRQAVGLVGNVLASSASQGLTAKDGSFAGFSNEKFEMPKFFGGKFSGGEISGTPGIDRIPTMLTEGEYVINARAAKQIGVPTLERINAGKYNQGGLVGDSTEKNLENSSSNPTNNINITVNVSSDNSSKENSSQDQDNSEPQKKKKSAEDLSKRIKQEVITVIKEENRPGGLLR